MARHFVKHGKACGGSCMAKPYSESQILINNFIANDHNWQGEGDSQKAIKQKSAGVLELDDLTAMRADIAKLANQMTRMTMQQQQPMQHQLRTDFKNLEKQRGQLATNQNTRPAGALPSDTEKNPQVNAVTLRNGRELEKVPKKRKDKATPEGELIPKETHESKNTDAIPEPDIVAHKRRLNEFETVALTEECTSRVQNNLPQKLKDPCSFTIPVRIGNIDLADRSIAHPEGVIEDVLLQIGKFIFPADFIILDYEADELVPIILGRPLLATGDAIINVREGKMILRVDDEEAVFNVYKAIQLPRHYEELSMISVVEVDEQILDTSVYLDDSLEKALMLFNSMGNDEE
ncbi:PREDICTED: uncharacterized protein LOC109222705, partial [Nicotiana attenuata]|uniref:uncharacterized protein LOC109222705 n=1 Tax=Nicotiana attenuata TaxID=49451 RepID=UPI00090492F3